MQSNSYYMPKTYNRYKHKGHVKKYNKNQAKLSRKFLINTLLNVFTKAFKSKSKKALKAKCEKVFKKSIFYKICKKIYEKQNFKESLLQTRLNKKKLQIQAKQKTETLFKQEQLERERKTVRNKLKKQRQKAN